ncbi:Protein misato 1 [Nowakowskiella sp. JEL0407]|nr:Protein misato 1 [Nowakowskiella sp. JEL0407]
MKEIITFQIGNYSNYIGTHFWNTQECYFKKSEELNQEDSPETEIDHDVLFRVGRSIWGVETFTPRLISINLKGSLGTMQRISQLYQQQQQQHEIDQRNQLESWGGSIHKIISDPLPKNEFLRALDEEDDEILPESQAVSSNLTPNTKKSYSKSLETSSRYWTDFNRTNFHPRSVVEVPSYVHPELGADGGELDSGEFGMFTQGREVFADEVSRDTIIEEKFRFFLEECDSLQGLNIISDVNNGFSGLTSDIVESIYDDNPKISVMFYGVGAVPFNQSGGKLSNRSIIEGANAALSLHRLTQFTSLSYIPLSSPSRALHCNNLRTVPYHTSGFLAAAIETMTIPMRLKQNPVHMYNINSSVGNSLANIFAMSAAAPFPVSRSSKYDDCCKPYLHRFAVGEDVTWLKDLTFDSTQKVEREISHFNVLRGVPEVYTASMPSKSGQVFRQTTQSLNTQFDEFLDSFNVSREYYSRLCTRFAFPVADTFPQYCDDLTPTGTQMDATIPKNETENIEQFACLARLRLTGKITEYITSSEKYLSSLGPRALLQFSKGDYGLTVEDIKTVRNELMELQFAFEELMD